MIEVKEVSKNFDDKIAVNNVSVSIKEGNVFGLIGTNGAGKSTLLRMITGVLKPDAGYIEIDEKKVFDNAIAKKDMFFIPDEAYFFANATAYDMKVFYQNIYENFATENFDEYLNRFSLEKRRKINTYSKGMKKQLSLLLGICSNTKYLICDETFDGLDPVMRQGIKSIFAQEMELRNLTPIIASHNLRELEDICDHLGVLHQGGVLLSKDLEELKCNILKIQCVFRNESDAPKMFGKLNIVKKEKRGLLYTLTARGNREEINALFHQYEMTFYEVLPLSLEEIFISETEVVGYDVKKLILN